MYTLYEVFAHKLQPECNKYKIIIHFFRKDFSSFANERVNHLISL